MIIAMYYGMESKQRYLMVRQCMYCQGVMGLKEAEQADMHMQASHGICEYCLITIVYKGEEWYE